MSYKIGDKRKQTMISKLGEAAKLVDNQAYLPFFRSVQIQLEKDGHGDEWGKMIAAATAEGIEDPKRYFAKLCKMVKDGTYKFVTKVKEVANEFSLYVHDKLIKYRFGKFHKYWVHKAQQFINVNGEAGFAELLEYADRKGINQKQMAAILKNCKTPRNYYTENILGVAK